MRADATHHARPGDGQPPADVLTGADEAPGRRSVVAAAAVLAALLAGAVVLDEPPDPSAPQLALGAGELVLRDRPVDDRLAEAALHVEVVNAGDRTLDLRTAALVPGAWEVDVVGRPQLAPGDSVGLALHRTVVCDERASYGPFPEQLVLETGTSGAAPVVVRLPLADAYDGRLDDALRDPRRACVATPGD